MTTIPSLPGATMPTLPTAPTLATVLGGDGVLAKLAGRAFEASVVQSARASVVARTAAGDITLRLPFPMAEGSRLTLQAPAGNPGVQSLRVLAVDGRPPPPGAPPAAAAPSSAGASPAAPGLSQPSVNATAASTLPAPSPGTVAPGTAVPAQAATGSFTATVLRGPEPPLPGAAAAPPAPPPPPGTALSVRLLAVETPSAPVALTAAPSPAGGPAILTGVVAPNSHAGQPLLQTPIGLLGLGTATPLPAGAVVTLTVDGLAPPPPPAAPPPLPAAVPGGRWPALTEAMQVLQRSDPVAAEALARILPQADGRAAANAAVFAAALRSGDARSWLGDTLGALERSGRKDVAKRLEEDVAEAGGRLRQPASGEWRAVPLPFFDSQGVEAVRVVVRRPPEASDEESGNSGGDEGIRFLVDLSLSQLGPLQIDGLVRRSSRRFDLVVRTRSPLAEEARSDIGGIFARALEGLGMSGSAVFQVTQRFVEAVPDDAAGGWRGVVV